MKLPRDKTAIVLIESQNDFLSPGGTIRERSAGDSWRVEPQDHDRLRSIDQSRATHSRYFGMSARFSPPTRQRWC
jgi:hypothetical protein